MTCIFVCLLLQRFQYTTFGFYLAFEFLDWLSSRRIPFSETHFGRVWRVAHAVLSVHPLSGRFLCS